MLPDSGVPACRRILTDKNVRSEILDNDQSVVHENGRHNSTVRVCHVTGECRDGCHHGFVWTVTLLRCLRSQKRCRQKGKKREEHPHAMHDSHTRFHGNRPSIHGTLGVECKPTTGLSRSASLYGRVGKPCAGSPANVASFGSTLICSVISPCVRSV